MSAILVVEQDPGYSNRVVAALQAAGHEVMSASSRDEAEAATAAGSFDLVLANGMMPGAADLLGRFSKGRGGPGSVVLLPVTLASHTEASAYSADDILSKPFSDEDLDRVVTGRLSTSPAAAALQPPPAQQAAPPATQPEAPKPEAIAPTPPQPAAPQPSAPQPPTAAPRRSTVKPRTVDSDIDDLLNKTLSGLDINALTRKRPKPKPKSRAPAPESAPAQPNPASSPESVAPATPPAQGAATPPSAEPSAPQPTPPEPPPQPASKPASLTSTDIFGDVLAEVEAESEKTRAGAQAATAPASAAEAPAPAAPQQAAPPPQPTSPQPAGPQPPVAPQQAATAPAAPPRRSSFDDDLDRKLEETLSGVLPSRLRRKAEEKPPAPAAAAPPPQNTPQPAAPQPAAPPKAFGAPTIDAAPPATPQPPEPELPVDFTEDETVSIVRPVTEPRQPAPPAAASDAGDGPEEQDFFATTLLPTRTEPSTEVQPPADFVPPAAEPSPAAPAPEPAPPAQETSASQPAASQPAAPEPVFDSGDEFEISFGEAEPTKQEDGNIWSAYGTEETAGWGTTSFEAQAPIAAQEPESTPEPAQPQPDPAAPEPTAPTDAEPNLDASGWGTDSGWTADTGWGTADSNAAAAPPPSAAPVPAEPVPAEPVQAEPVPAEPVQAETPQAEPDFGSDSVWDVPSFEEESTSSEVAAPTDLATSPPEPASPEPAVPGPLAPEPTAPEPAATEPAAAEFAAPDLESPELDPPEPTFQPPTFEEGPSLGEDPELEFESSDFAPADFQATESAPELDPAPAPSLATDEPAPAESQTTESTSTDATGTLGELSTELGGDDSGSFHTALQGVLQIRGENGEGSKSDDQGVPFGDYRLLERVAVGGMAEVWRARRRGVEGFQKTVAIKRILSHLTGSTDFINMFIDEAKLAAQLNHANIAQIYDLGKVDDDFFIAMEFVEGRDLRTLLRESRQKGRPLPLGQALFIVAAVARALDYAHRKRDFEDRELGLVHRDVSPQNVLVSTEGEIKLCDFGIVKAVAKASTTQMGALKGKLQYMSPEQAWGKEVDGRSDIFSLGTVMFEALTGEKLFTGDSEIGVLDAVRDCRIKSARAIDPSLPESVEAILQKTLTATPEERYQTAGEMERDIQSVLETLKPSPGQSELARYMHGLLEAEETAEDASQDASSVAAGTVDEDGTAWTGTAWGTASFTEDEADLSEPVSAKIPVAGATAGGSTGSFLASDAPSPEPLSAEPLSAEPLSSKPPEPVTSTPPAMSSSKVPVPAQGKKSGGKLIWILLVITMLAIVGVVVWTQLGSGSDSSDTPAAGSPPAAAPADALPEPSGDAGADGEVTNGDAPAEDPEAIMQQMLQEEMERKKQEMEEQFEAQKREIERRLKEVEGEGG